jgi:hypothetical protein
MMSYDNNLEREFRISGLIDSATPVGALGDAGSNRNTMDEVYVRKRGYKIDGGAASTVRVGQKTVKTVGVVHLPFRFRDETTSYSLRSHVISKCPEDVILGYPFLKATKTSSNTMNFARRVFDRNVTHMSRYRDMLCISDIRPKFTGTIGGRPYEALADTWSKVLIVEEDFALSRGLPIIGRGTSHQAALYRRLHSSYIRHDTGSDIAIWAGQRGKELSTGLLHSKGRAIGLYP